MRFLLLVLLSGFFPLGAEELFFDYGKNDPPATAVQPVLTEHDRRIIGNYECFAAALNSEDSVSALSALLEKDPWSRTILGVLLAEGNNQGKNETVRNFLIRLSGKTDSPYVACVAGEFLYTARDLNRAGNTLKKALTHLTAAHSPEELLADPVLRLHLFSTLSLLHVCAEAAGNGDLRQSLNSFREEHPEIFLRADFLMEQVRIIAVELKFMRRERNYVPVQLPFSLPEIKLTADLLSFTEKYFTAAEELPAGADGLEGHSVVFDIVRELDKEQNLLYPLLRSILLGNGSKPGQLWQLARLYRNLKQPAMAARSMEMYLDLSENFRNDDILFLMQCQIESGFFRLGVKTCEKYLPHFSGEDQKYLRYYYAIFLEETGQFGKALRQIRNLPPCIDRYALELPLLMRHGNNKEALETAKRTVQLFHQNKVPIPEQFGMMFIDIADRCNDIAFLESFYPEMLKHYPENAMLFNNLGYIYAERNIKLHLAEKLIFHALRKEGGNPAILDSVAWLRYRQEKYAEAKDMILKALSKHDDPDILNHAGDIHAALGEEEAAAGFWKRAAALCKDKTLKGKIMEKLKNTEINKQKTDKK